MTKKPCMTITAVVLSTLLVGALLLFPPEAISQESETTGQNQSDYLTAAKKLLEEGRRLNLEARRKTDEAKLINEEMAALNKEAGRLAAEGGQRLDDAERTPWIPVKQRLMDEARRLFGLANNLQDQIARRQTEVERLSAEAENLVKESKDLAREAKNIVDTGNLPSAAPSKGWEPLGAAETATAKERLLPELSGRSWRAALLGNARRMRLPFYPNAFLIEIDAITSDGRDGRYSFVDAGNHITLIDGNATTIHNLNGRLSLSLGDAEHAEAYLRFFCESIAAGHGPFKIVDSIADLPWLPSAEADTIVSAQQKIVPVPIGRSGDAWTAVASIYYGGMLFAANFEIDPGGNVRMIDDSLYLEKLPVANVYFEMGLRITGTPG